MRCSAMLWKKYNQLKRYRRLKCPQFVIVASIEKHNRYHIMLRQNEKCPQSVIVEIPHAPIGRNLGQYSITKEGMPMFC